MARPGDTLVRSEKHPVLDAFLRGMFPFDDEDNVVIVHPFSKEEIEEMAAAESSNGSSSDNHPTTVS